MFGFRFLLSISAVLSAACASVHAAPVSYTTSWIANDGGWSQTHVPHDMLDMFVRADGTVATICGWDEGGSNVAVYRDGRMVSCPEGSGTGGWGRMSGKQVVMDDKYVYQLLTQHGRDGGNDRMNDNGVRQYPPNDPAKEWKTIRRYDLETGKGAPFPGGFGYRGDMIVVCDEQPRSLEGLAIGDGRLYVSVTALPGSGRPDEVVIYDTARMERVGGFELTRPAGKLAADDRGGLWLMSAGEIVRLDAKTGRATGPSLKIPSGVTAISFGLDLPRGRLLLPNRGKDMNVLVFDNIYRRPRLAELWGVKGGVFASDAKHPSGAAGALRFSGPAGAGFDAAGNFYVCNTTVSGGRGTSLEAYGKDRRLLWKREGLIFTATADVSPARPNVLYTPEKIHAISESRVGGRLDELVAYTADPFRFPEDERVRPNGPFVTSTFKRTIGGREFLFVSDMYGSMLAGYRFDAARLGYVGIPCVTFGGGSNDKPMTLWTDGNGDGRPQDSEMRTFPQVNPYAMNFFVDDDGNVWRGVRERGVLCWKFRALDAHGVPTYDDPVRFELPEGFRDAKRVWYDAARRELFISGFSHARPDAKDTWWCMGSTIVRCSDPLAKGALKADLVFYVPFSVEDGSGRDHTNAKAFCVVGDYVFVSLARNGFVDIYRRDTGASVGRLEPGEAVHRQSGWSDFNYCINACRLADGRYLVLNEENAFAKVMVYHVTFAAE